MTWSTMDIGYINIRAMISNRNTIIPCPSQGQIKQVKPKHKSDNNFEECEQYRLRTRTGTYIRIGNGHIEKIEYECHRYLENILETE